MIDDLVTMPASAGQDAAAQAARVAWLFRHTLRRGGVHPLLPAMLPLHGVEAGLPDNVDHGSAQPLPGDEGEPEVLRWRIAPETLSRQVQDLPGLPKALTDAMALMRQDDSSAADLAACIEQDQSLTARALRVANSAFYGVSGRVGSVRNAIDILGRRAVQSLLTTSALAEQFELPAGSAFDRSQFWQHTMASAMLARSLAGLVRRDEEAAFTSALLHDIGTLALATRFDEQANAVAMMMASSDQPQTLVEQRLLGLDHAEVGASVAARWHFPETIVAAIRFHHQPLKSPLEAAAVCDLVHLADAAAHGLDLGQRPSEAVPEVDLQVWDRTGLVAGDLEDIMRETREQVIDLCKALGV